MLSQDEIDALLGGNGGDSGAAPHIILTDDEKDILGEVGNITMGTSATTLYALLGEKVCITTPKVSIVRWRDLPEGHERPSVGIRVDYKEGIEGSNLLILRNKDVKVIANLMLGIPPERDADRNLNDLDLSAISEAMNQMVGSSSTSISSLVGMRIDINTPMAFILDATDSDVSENIPFVDDEVVCIAFRMEIGKLVDSEIMQVLPYDFAMRIADIIRGGAEPSEVSAPKRAAVPLPAPRRQYNARPAQFASFDATVPSGQRENIGLIMDVELNVTVELGRSQRKIKDILEFSPGTVVELDKLAGDPIDVLVNGKRVAKGEVVVVDENFGIRITEIVNANII
jgi:flagellar motor switch protein FliN/FliY